MLVRFEPYDFSGSHAPCDLSTLYQEIEVLGKFLLGIIELKALGSFGYLSYDQWQDNPQFAPLSSIVLIVDNVGHLAGAFRKHPRGYNS